MLELVILAVLGVWLALAVRSCLRRRERAAVTGAVTAADRAAGTIPAPEAERPARKDPAVPKRDGGVSICGSFSNVLRGHSHFFRLKYQIRPITTAALTKITAG